jgi:hypothetical protein
MKVTLSKGGTRERVVEIEALKIPDLWHIAMAEKDKACSRMILDCWHIAHDLKRELSGLGKGKQ